MADGARIGGTLSRLLVVGGCLTPFDFRSKGIWTTRYLDCESAVWEGQVVIDAYTSERVAVGATSVAGQTGWEKT